MSNARIMRAGHRWAVFFTRAEVEEALKTSVEMSRCLQGPLHHRHDEPALAVEFHASGGATVSAEYDPDRDGTILSILDCVVAEDAGRQYAQAVRDCFALPAVRAAAALWGRECFLRSIALHPADVLGAVSWVVSELEDGGTVVGVAAALARALTSAAGGRGDPRNWRRFAKTED